MVEDFPAKEESIIREVLLEGLDDWVPVDRVIGMARELAEEDGEEFRGLATSVLELVLRRELMTVGEIGESGFESWLAPADAVVASVVARLDGVDWLPLGGACWLANTSAGDRLATEWLAG
ncbi:hypothetical protein [Goodfellowiella coeruleoviolacea]|nr:hypothetical protein [Goodfellowiella coeruleoviolacea]